VSSPRWLLSVGTRETAVSWRSVIAWAIVLGLAAHVTVRAGRPEPRTVPLAHSHTSISLVLAMNWAFCGKYSTWSQRHAPSLANLLEAEEFLDLPLSDLPARAAGSVAAYCRTLDTGYVNAENSLMLVEGVYLQAFPDVTIRGLDRAMRRLQWILVLPFVAVALRGGASLALAFGLWCAALLTNSLLNDAISCSSYGFLGPALLLVVAIVGAANDVVARRRAPTCVAVGSIVGFVFGFVGNLRTSYLPIVLAALAVASLCLAARLGRAAGPRGLASILGIALGWWIFHLAFIAPLGQSPASQSSSAEHHFYHPLVLGLANPPNRLAEEERITWNDGAGLGLAARADPSLAGAASHWSVPMATYEAALRKYYLQLWRQRPRDML